MKSSVRWLFRIVFVAAAVYLFLGFAVVAVLSKPKRHLDASKNPGTHGIAYQDVRFASRGGDAELAAWYLPHASHNAALVLVHGKDGSRTHEQNRRNDEFMSALYRQGFTVLAMDLRGHGQSSPGRFSFGINESRDVLGGFDYLQKQGFDQKHIGLHGVSMGAASVLLAAAQEPAVKAVIADCGYADFGRIMRREWYRRTHLPSLILPSAQVAGQLWLGHDVLSVRPIDRVADIKSQVLFIHAANDTLIPPSDSQDMQAKLPGSALWIQPGARHAAGFDADPTGYVQHVADFFGRTLRN